MGRRRAGAFDDLLSVATRLPWKLDLTLALAAFLVFHLIAAATVQGPSPVKPGELGSLVIFQFAHVLALLFQFVVPAAFVIGAVASFIKRSRSKDLMGKVRSSELHVDSISWERFESLVAEGFRQRGFRVAERGGRAPDGGIDLDVVNESGRFLVQCKQWRARQVGVSIIREFYGVIIAGRASGGWVVTSGRFTDEARRFAEANGIQLLDGSHLNEFLRGPAASAESSKPERVIAGVATDAPSCPVCRTLMVERVAKKGMHAGGKFWGCRNYPRCRKILPKAA